MELAGTKEEYIEELHERIKQGSRWVDFDEVAIEGDHFAYVYEGLDKGQILSRHLYLGIMDERAVTPECLDEAIDELIPVVRRIENDEASFLGVGYAPLLIILGVTDHVGSDIRDYINEQSGFSKGGFRFPHETIVVDVSAGTVLSTSHDLSRSEQLEEHYLRIPFE